MENKGFSGEGALAPRPALRRFLRVELPPPGAAPGPVLLGDMPPVREVLEYCLEEGEVWCFSHKEAGPRAGIGLLPYAAFARAFTATAAGLEGLLPSNGEILWLATAWGDAALLPALLAQARRQAALQYPGLTPAAALPFSAPGAAVPLVKAGYWGAAFCQLWRLRPCILFIQGTAPGMGAGAVEKTATAGKGANAGDAPQKTAGAGAHRAAVPMGESYRLSRLMQEGWFVYGVGEPAPGGPVLLLARR